MVYREPSKIRFFFQVMRGFWGPTFGLIAIFLLWLGGQIGIAVYFFGTLMDILSGLTWTSGMPLGGLFSELGSLGLGWWFLKLIGAEIALMIIMAIAKVTWAFLSRNALR